MEVTADTAVTERRPGPEPRPAAGADAGSPTAGPPSPRSFPWVEGLVTATVVVAVVAYTFANLQPRLLLTDTTPAGGDMGAHVWGPAYLRDHLLPSFRLSGWTPDWYAGFPAYHFYMVVPSLLIVALDVVLPYNIAFKLVTVVGLLALPAAAYALGRLARVPFPGPALLAVAAVPFLFDRSFTIYGGNVASTLAGEFAFSISLALAVVFVGVVLRGLDTGHHRIAAAVLLALTAVCHLIPAIFALVAGALALMLRFDLRRLRWALTAGLTGSLLTAWWTVPFLLRRGYLNDMGWEKSTTYWERLFPGPLGDGITRMFGGDAAADVSGDITWVAVLAVVGAGTSLVFRRRLGIYLTVLGLVFAVAFVLAPQGRLWNARLLPFWYLSLYFLAALAVAEVALSVATLLARRDRDQPSRVALIVAPLVVAGAMAVVVGLPLRSLPFGATVDGGNAYRWAGFRTTDSSFVPDWARWNYSGYERKPSYPEYRDVVDTMARLGDERGCGRAMWEYEKELDRYGTPMALMLLPYWTDGCIGSMEGLYFEASATTPYHFLNQSELSAAPSRAQRDLPYGPLDVDLGVDHLQLLGVRYYMAFSTEAARQAEAEPELEAVASSGPWRIYEVADRELVVPLDAEPAVVTGVAGGGREWLDVAVDWYLDRDAWEVALAASGPDRWDRVAPGQRPLRRPVPPAEVSAIEAGDDTISFRVDRPGTPVLVKASYFPNWQASGADGPWRVAPNLMVVVPTAEQVTLRYGTTPVDWLGWVLTAGGVVALVVLHRRGPVTVLEHRRRRRHVGGPPTRPRLRRFAAVSAVVTAIDIGLLGVLVGVGVGAAGADAVSVAVASVVSWLLHRASMATDDPHLRWVRQPRAFVTIAVVAGVVDVAVVAAFTAADVGGEIGGAVAVGKAVALVLAGAVRVLGYRGLLLTDTRRALGARQPRPEPAGDRRLTVVVPAYREADRITTTVAGLRQALAGVDAEFVVVDDGSPDETAERAEAAGARVVRLAENRGKGAAVRAGVLAARGRTVAFTDADLAYPPELLLTLLAEVESGWDVVVGSRGHPGSTDAAGAPRLRTLASRAFNLLTATVLLGQYRDTQCGIKAFRSDVAHRIFSRSRVDGFAFDIEVLHLVERDRLSLLEVPVTLVAAEGSTVSVVGDALQMLRDLVRIRWWSGRGDYDRDASEQPVVSN